MKQRLKALIIVMSCLLSMVGLAQAQEWKPALPGYSYEFPRDHGSHPEHKIEWWYFTGNLHTAEGRRLGYQLTFFRIGAVTSPANESAWALRDVWMAHFAVSDPEADRYHCADRLNRAGPQLAGASPERIWNEDWSCIIAYPSGQERLTLKAADRNFSIDLTLSVEKKAAIHGRNGVSQKGANVANASHYYSLTRMPTRGSVTIGDKTFEVSGESWMDHEFGSSFLEKSQQGWDWFSAQLSDGSELMLFQLRQTVKDEGEADMSAGTFIKPDGEVIALGSKDFQLTPKATWSSSPAAARYPVEWEIRVPSLNLSLSCRAVMKGQEFRASATPGLNYWEGMVDYAGGRAGRKVSGAGYLEMTGYGGQAMSIWFGAKSGTKE